MLDIVLGSPIFERPEVEVVLLVSPLSLRIRLQACCLVFEFLLGVGFWVLALGFQLLEFLLVFPAL